MKLPQTVRLHVSGHEAALLLNLLQQARTEAELARRTAVSRTDWAEAQKAIMRTGRVFNLVEEAMLTARRV